MNRRKALAVSVACTAVLASVAVAYAATMSVGWLGFGAHNTTRRVTNAAEVVPQPTSADETTTTAVEPQVVVEQRDVYDRHVVVVPATDPTEPVASAAGVESDVDEPTTTSTATASPSSSASESHESESDRSSESHDSESEHEDEHDG